MRMKKKKKEKTAEKERMAGWIHRWSKSFILANSLFEYLTPDISLQTTNSELFKIKTKNENKVEIKLKWCKIDLFYNTSLK